MLEVLSTPRKRLSTINQHMPKHSTATHNNSSVASTVSLPSAQNYVNVQKKASGSNAHYSPTSPRSFSDVDEVESDRIAFSKPTTVRFNMPPNRNTDSTIRGMTDINSTQQVVDSSPSPNIIAASFPMTGASTFAIGMGKSDARRVEMRVVQPADSESLSTSQGLPQAPSENFLAEIIAGSPAFTNIAIPPYRHDSNQDIPLSASLPVECYIQSAASTPPMPIPPVSPRRTSSSSAVSPVGSNRHLHRYRSETNISRSHNTPRTLKKSRHARSMSFGNSDDEDDLDWRAFRDSPPSLPLVPYKNQVGGHASFLRFSDKALCKPLNTRERDFYEIVETMHPEIRPFIATYLGVVNVTYSTASADDPFGVAEGTPVVILEENKHILWDDNDNKGTPNNDSHESINNVSNCSRRLQQQVFKDALSPQSLRTRFAQLKTAIGAMKRRHSFSGADKSQSEHLVDAKSPLAQKTSFSAESLHDDGSQPESGMPEGSSDALSPIFQMSDDEEDKATDSHPQRRHHNARHMSLNSRLIRSPSTPVRPKIPIDEEHTENDIQLPSTPTQPSSVNYNPWSLHLYNNAISNLSKDKAKRTHQFLLLEDLTQGLKFPCILDLKMGSRQHGVHATPEKRMSQEKKCEKSTSKKLGVRICGMQIYKTNTGSFTYLDKYVGRQINAGNFKQSLLSFLDNGEKYLIGYIPRMLEKLKALHDVVAKMSSYRFYASSLLMLYDGAWTEESTSSPFEFAVTDDNGEYILRDSRRNREVDMKMIDFANCVANAHLLRRLDDPETTTESGQCAIHVPFPPTTKGPDNGYLLGLRTLIKNFEELYRELGGGGPLVNANGHVSKAQLTTSQRVSVCGFTGSTELLSSGPILLAGSAPTGNGGDTGRRTGSSFVVMHTRYVDGDGSVSRKDEQLGEDIISPLSESMRRAGLS